MSVDGLLIEVAHDVLRLTIDRPAQRNALRLDLLDGIGATLREHADAPDLVCAIITGRGERAFAAGGDLKELDAYRTPEQAQDMARRGRDALNAVREFPLPVVAGLNGVALGGGAELALACDLRIASAHAEIGMLQGALNVTTAWGGGIDLIAAVGPARAMDILLGARRIAAAEALRLGLFAQVCREDESLDAALNKFIAPWQARSRGVLRGYKALNAAHRRALHTALTDVEQRHIVDTWIHDDHWRAVAAAMRPKP